MATIVTRAGKGSTLTHDEMDANFNNLNTDKVETSIFPNVNSTVNASDEELNFSVGVTSDIQTQLDSKADAVDLPSGNWELIDSWVPTAITLKDFTWDESLYSAIHVECTGVATTSDGSQLWINFGHTNGSTILNDAHYNYSAKVIWGTSYSATTGVTKIIWASQIGNAAGEGLSFSFDTIGFNSTVSPKSIKGVSNTVTLGGSAQSFEISATYDALPTTIFDTLEFSWSMGTFVDGVGKFFIYGLKNS